MKSLEERILSIQNSQRSLKWGSAEMTDTEVVFAVGHSFYKGKEHLHFLSVDTKTYSLYSFDTKHREPVVENATPEEVIKGVVMLLKKWFPPLNSNTDREVAQDADQPVFQSAT